MRGIEQRSEIGFLSRDIIQLEWHYPGIIEEIYEVFSTDYSRVFER